MRGLLDYLCGEEEEAARMEPATQRERKAEVTGRQDLILAPHKMISVRPRAFVASREGKKKGEWKRWLNQ